MCQQARLPSGHYILKLHTKLELANGPDVCQPNKNKRNSHYIFYILWDCRSDALQASRHMGSQKDNLRFW